MLPPSRLGFCIFRPCRRWIFELPRISDPSAPLSRQLRVSPQPRLSSCACRRISRVAPVPASSGFAGDGLSSYLASRVLRRLCCLSFGFPLHSALPVAPPGMVAGFPALPFLPALPRVRVHESPRFLLPLAPADGSPSCPGSRTFRLAVPASSGFPESCIYGWVNDDFPVLLELCILGWSADESSWSIGSCAFQSDSGCALQFHSGFNHAGKPT